MTDRIESRQSLAPVEAPLYDPRFEHDACGVGFVADLSGHHSSKLVGMALDALAALEHRGGRAADDRTGDGAGISFPLTRAFLRRLASDAGVADAPDHVAVGMLFLPEEPAARERAIALIEDAIHREGLAVAGWRSVPVRAELLDGRIVGGRPVISQVFVGRPRGMLRIGFARRLLFIRRAIEHAARDDATLDELTFASLSAETIVYKGLFVGRELGRFYRDLELPDLAPRYVLFHQRYSTNTFPSWRLAQPFRYLAHNGEINTLRSNREAVRGRRRSLGGGSWTRALDDGPLLTPDGSDSLALDETLELMVLAGIPIDEALRRLIPPAPGLVGTDVAAMPVSEPWDGPAAIAFGDGRVVGCAMDRNGLRPAARTTTDDGLVVVASEAGCVDLGKARIASSSRLGPGEMVVVDLVEGRTRTDAHRLPRPSVGTASPAPMSEPLHLPAETADDRLRVALGLDAEALKMVIRPMATSGREAVWSMGDDTPIAPLAQRPRRVTAFLRQSFAQVTNPAIDPERERIVMSTAMAIGRQPGLLDLDGRGVAVRPLDTPVLDRIGWARLTTNAEGWRVVRLDATWPAGEGADGLATALDRLARSAQRAARSGAHLLALTDRRAGRRRVPIPPVLAAGAVHQALLAGGRRPRTDLVVEAGECFDVHDVAMLLAVGASAVHPWLMLELAAEVAGSRGAEELDRHAAIANVLTALEYGLRKVLARMGISTIASYRGGQLFDALGLEPEVVDRCFPAAATWPGTIGFVELGESLLARHRSAYAAPPPELVDPGLIRYRGSGEAHAFAPRTVKAIQQLATGEDGTEAALAAYREALAEPEPRQPRDLLALRAANEPLRTDDVEPASAIARRFVSSAMSLGALSPEAHQALAIGMARLGGAANTGEGGEDPTWYQPLENGDRRDAAIKQVASARFGVTADYLARAEQLEIKIAQGSKPGEGGQLPGRKATAFIAGLRRGQPGMTMISPPPHHDIYSIEDLAQLITDLRAINPSARIGVKLVAGAGIGTIAAGVAKAHADYIMVSGHSGGTGASPLSSIKHAGLPWELGLAEVHQVLVRNRLRDRVVLRVDGGLRTGRDVVVAALLGAEEFGFGTSALVALGCDMARQCHLDTCPTGIATQREDLRAKFTGRPEDVVAYFSALAEDVRRELAAIGLSRLTDAVGRADLLEATPGALDLARVMQAPVWSVPASRADFAPRDTGLTHPRPIASRWEAGLVVAAVERTDRGRPVRVRARIDTTQRSVGAQLAGELSRRPEPRTPPRVVYQLNGSAGQSLGAFTVPGMRIVVTGEANDYVGKGLSGGTVVVRPDLPAETESDLAVAGNTCLYGATGGRLHLVGRAGMRFAIRNSGARAVVEGIGPHGCEYMTGGTVVVLGPIGANFGAGMTGGRAFLYDADGSTAARLNDASVGARPVDGDPALDAALRQLIRQHAEEGSARAARLLASWEDERRRFLVIEPRPEVAPAVSATELERRVAGSAIR